jgi:hypothetical protein
MKPTSRTLTGTGYGAPIPLNVRSSLDFFTAQVSNGGGYNYTVQVTLTDPYARDANGNLVYADAAAFSNGAAWSNTSISGATATTILTQFPLAAAVRLIAPSTASGSCTLTVLQGAY